MKLYRNKIISILILAIIVLASLLLSACGKEESNFNSFKTFEDLKGCTFAISDGNSSYEKNISEELPDVKFDRYTNYFDTFIAVANGNADAAFAFKYTFYGIKESYPNLDYVESNIKIPIVASFSNESNELKDDFNNFVAEAKESDLIEKLAEKWMYKYDELCDKIFETYCKDIKFAENDEGYDLHISFIIKKMLSRGRVH